jgi:hypothetical protein
VQRSFNIGVKTSIMHAVFYAPATVGAIFPGITLINLGK